MRGRLAPLPTDTGDGRTVEVRLIPWDTPARVSDDGRTWYREQFARGGLRAAPGRMLVRLEHAGPVIGRIDGVDDRDDGLYGVLRIADTGPGRDALALVADGVLDAVSIEFDDTARPPAADALVTRSTAVLTGVALTLAPQHESAAVLAVRAHPDGGEMDETPGQSIDELEHTGSELPESDVPEPDPDEPDPDDEGDTTVPTTDPDPVAELVRSAPTPRRQPAPTPTPSRWRSFGEFLYAVHNGELRPDEARRHLRAWTDELVADVPGLLPEAWLSSVVNITAGETPTVQAFSRNPLPAIGSVVNIPVVTTAPPVAKQTVGKTEIASGKLVVSDVPATIAPYAGGQDIDIRVLNRSTPAYMTVLMNVYAGEMAKAIETDAAGLVLAGSDDFHTVAVTVDPDDPNAGFVTGAATLFGTTNRWPEVAVLGVGLWEALAGATGVDGRPLFPSVSPVNPVGQSSITSGDGSVRGLTFYVSPAMGDNGVMGVRDAFTTLVGSMQSLGVDNPKLLGRDVAVFTEAAMAVTDARGLVKLSLVPPV